MFYLYSELEVLIMTIHRVIDYLYKSNVNYITLYVIVQFPWDLIHSVKLINTKHIMKEIYPTSLLEPRLILTMLIMNNTIVTYYLTN